MFDTAIILFASSIVIFTNELKLHPTLLFVSSSDQDTLTVLPAQESNNSIIYPINIYNYDGGG